MFWRRKKTKDSEFREFPDAASFWMACAAMNIGPVQLRKPYVSLVLHAEERKELGQLFWIRVAILPEPPLVMVANITPKQFGKRGHALKNGDLVLWVPAQLLPQTGRAMNMSDDPRADYLGFISAQVRPAMNIKTGQLSIVQDFSLP